MNQDYEEKEDKLKVDINSRRKMTKHRTKKNLFLKVFLCTMLVMGLSIGLLVGGGTVAYHSFVYEKGTVVELEKKQEGAVQEEIVQEGHVRVENKQQNIVTTLTKKQEKLDKTVAIFGTDYSGRLTDVIFLAHFNSETKEVSLLSIPRDTKVDWTEEQISILPQRHQWIRYGKINEMTSWGGIEHIRALTLTTIETLLGIHIDGYVIVNLDAFRQIVDAVGGIEIDVQQYMEMRDHSQGLSISLTPGLQVLDGNKAEQFVRFRGYKSGDLGRIEAQQKFLEAFAKKILSIDTLKKFPQLMDIIFSSLKTDISLTELTTYLPYTRGFNMDQLHFYVLPGDARYENNISYYFFNEEQALEMVDHIFFNKSE